TVASGSTLQLSSTGSNSITMAFGGNTGNSTSIAGNLILNSNTSNNNSFNFNGLTVANNVITGTVTNNGGIVSSAISSLTFGAGSTYIHAMNGGAIPYATWNATSTCSVTGITTTDLT